MGRQVLTDQVFEAILAQLLDNEVPAGASLTIDRLARDFGVSITPVREALARLETTGMVRREALRGYRVAPAPTPAEVRDLLEARRMLEPELAARAVASAPPTLVADLERISADLDRAQAGGDAFADWRPYWNADEVFHRRIAEAVGSDAMLRMYLSTEGYTQRFRLLVHNQMSGEYTVEEHRKIVDAARHGSPEDARQAMLQHIDGITRRALELPMFASEGGSGQ
ncbi:MAG TPA: GntR family transcriptional regulator [Flexivirga sp.]|uniref:GntR family transcriptional regulator n=1 Tax=Flexivirga sp. TaxID=1962927 RepID=UPI002CC7198C|nr:GntR family transcriptional regulator [Flexivirga sp.]HWC22794.1 GntR family transcriptional regulator [Flexivirga sp.]